MTQRNPKIMPPEVCLALTDYHNITIFAASHSNLDCEPWSSTNIDIREIIISDINQMKKLHKWLGQSIAYLESRKK